MDEKFGEFRNLKKNTTNKGKFKDPLLSANNYFHPDKEISGTFNVTFRCTIY